MNGIILTWLLVCVLACGARHISDENRHSVQSNRQEMQSNDESGRGGQKQRLLNHSRMEKKFTSSSSRDSGEDSMRSKELNDSFDEYPIVTPKRAAMLLDRIMVALHHALEDSEDGKVRKINDIYRDGHYYGSKSAKEFGHKSMKYPSPHKTVKDSDDAEIVETVYDDIPEELSARSLDSAELDGNLVTRDNTMDLQRRGHDVSTGSAAGANGVGKGRVYWRCYFNAVTCF